MELSEEVGAALARGDRDAAVTLVIERLGAQVHSYLQSILRDREVADDVFSVFAEHVWTGIGSLEDLARIRGWAYRVAWNAATRVHRDPYRRRRERFKTTMASRVAASILATGRSLERKASALDELRATLTPEEQSLLILRVDRDLTWREVAEVVGEEGLPVDEAVLRKRFERLKEKLGRLAAEKGMLDPR
jgi:RNA polymerase sigma-70 factor (ECF subfamily)